ncbi:dihydrolipoyl dehydrogenase [Halochromatium roseum]|uniref:dihydrolipoyl dehydrogenase n=1 Tax=Halochromatium roseum TaxID=391920 RepID=UPI0019137486|nr:dihydrolipoyl dehydrogenase [Halochromatium roseum]MBK5939705.1 dihydrolipoyl dehydrogenase [Halochromatium roseum]
MQERFVDIAIIGAGTSGLNAMSQARKAGKSFVLINGGEPGTTCARVGCMPSKAMIQVAEDYHRRTHLGRYGIDGHEGLSLDLPEALEHVQDIRDTFVDRVLGSSTDDLPEDMFLQDYARFLEPTLLAVGEQRIRAGAVIIATGSRPLVPEPWRAFGDKLLTTDSLFELEDLPRSIAVIGLGTIGLELGQSLHRLGIQVEGFDQLETIAGLRDPEVAKTAIQVIGKEFPLHLGQPAQISEDGEQLRIQAGDHQISVDAVLCSIGRVPNLEGLGLENLGVELDARGLPPFDRHSMQVGGLPMFIAGDVTAERPVLHEAGDEGRIAGFNAVRITSQAAGEPQQPLRFRRRTPLYINFCDPNICAIGERFDALDPDQIAIGEIKMAPVGRALIMGNNRGLIRVYADKTNGRLLGAELIAPRGENLAHLLSWSIQQGMTVEQMLRMPFYHPVIEEALQAALNDLNRKLEVERDGPLTELALLS